MSKSAVNIVIKIKQDIHRRDEMYANNFTDDQKEAAIRMSRVLGQIHDGRRTFINYRKKFIAIKVENPAPSLRIPERARNVNKRTKQLALLAELQAQYNITMRCLNGHYVYQIPVIVPKQRGIAWNVKAALNALWNRYLR